MLTMRRWEHQRTLTPIDEATTSITDRITLEPRLRLLAPLMANVLRSFFGHRHRRLARHFGFWLLHIGTLELHCSRQFRRMFQDRPQRVTPTGEVQQLVLSGGS